MYRAGLRELRLIYSSKPRWYFRQAERVLTAILESYLSIFEPRRFLRALASPTFFDGLVASASLDELGGGATTIVAATLKNFVRPDSGLAVVGGKRPHGYRVPEELDELASIFGFDERMLEKLKYASRMVAKVDNAAIQDGFQLYLHIMIVSWDGEWVIIQQGLKPMTNLVRRYHWISMGLRSFVEEPHSGIAGIPGQAINATASESRGARRAYLDILAEGPSRAVRLLGEANRMLEAKPSLEDYTRGGGLKRGNLIGLKPYYYPVKPSKQILKAIEDLAKFNPTNELELALAPSLGPKTLRALALIADLIYRVETSTKDPVTHPPNPFIYAYAVGGKDRIPYPYDRRTAEKVILTLEEAVNKAKLGEREKLKAILKLRKLLPPNSTK